MRDSVCKREYDVKKMSEREWVRESMTVRKCESVFEQEYDIKKMSEIKFVKERMTERNWEGECARGSDKKWERCPEYNFMNEFFLVMLKRQIWV